MNTEEKEKIKELRIKGMGYREISSNMNISLNTIKSYCKRNGLGNEKGSENISSSEFCGKAIYQNRKRKKKRFCSDSCRNAWWNKHKDAVNKKANYELVCKNCKNVFTSYGNKGRKFCSHACYISYRFGGRHHECH
ncbi:RNA polymerase subunit sigma-70 [Streptococcus gallinaceus]|uniref:IS30 family transposase n=1 Tax=Streptococcus gallinaceus TaxID=165758 RepID=A0ABV2JIZ7_9STRE